jgi:hypothetical protein
VTTRELIAGALRSSLDPRLVDELLDAYEEIKRHFYSGGLRLQEVEGGRFCEAALRLLQQRAWGSFDPLGTPIDTERVIRNLGNLPGGSEPDSVRLHIPRVLRVIYDIRNKRDAAHLADDIDPNLQDATLVATAADWILAEFFRLYHHVTADEAAGIVNELVTRRAPVVQDFQGFLKVLNPQLRAGEVCLVLAYQRGSQGMQFNEVNEWVPRRMRRNLRRTLTGLVENRAFLHFDGSRYFITEAGMEEVEGRGMLTPRS